MTQTQTSPEIDKVFLEQARSLIAGGELLPGGEAMLAKKLQRAAVERKPLRVKLGLDPTRPDLHLGHTVVLRKLRAFQDLGHQAVLIIGDATAMIGDPSGRSQTRPPLTDAEVQANAQTYLDQAGKIIDVRKAEIVRNSEWLSGMTLSDFLKLAAKVTVAQILVRDDFAKRYGENKPISLHELFYPLMQGYDSVVVKSDIELGGTDQRFNNLMGRELQLAYAASLADEAQTDENNGDDKTSAQGTKTDPQLVLLMPLLEGTDGKIKMSKSYPEHCINITDTAEDMYGKLMSIPDEMIFRYERLLTPISEDQLKEHEMLAGKPESEGGINPRDLKANLARWITGQYHGMDGAQQAEEAFISRFRNKEIPDDMPEITLPAGSEHHLATLMAEHQLAPSKAEARRLIQGGGVRLAGEKVADAEFNLTGTAGSQVILQVGKRKFLKIKF